MCLRSSSHGTRPPPDPRIRFINIHGHPKFQTRRPDHVKDFVHSAYVVDCRFLVSLHPPMYKKPGNWLIPSTHSLAHHSGGRLIVPKRDHRIYSQSWDLCWDSALFNFLWAYYIAKLSSHLDSINPRPTSLLIPCLAALDWSIESMSSRRFAFRSHY